MMILISGPTSGALVNSLLQKPTSILVGTIIYIQGLNGFGVATVKTGTKSLPGLS
jgi:hypothetical protein